MKLVLPPVYDSANTAAPPEITVRVTDSGEVRMTLESPGRHIIISREDWLLLMKVTKP